MYSTLCLTRITVRGMVINKNKRPKRAKSCLTLGVWLNLDCRFENVFFMDFGLLNLMMRVGGSVERLIASGRLA